MNPLLIGPLAEIIKTVVNRLLPADPEKAAQAQLELLKMQQAGELAELTAATELAKGQLEINTEEAKSDSTFVAGWRPFIGWTCGSAFAIQFVVGPLLAWGSAFFGHPITMPRLDFTEMMPVLFGMLGLGAYRTYEKVKGTK